MARKSKKAKAAVHKGQKAELARKQALKERLLKQRKRQPRIPDFLEEAQDLYDDGEYEEVCDLIKAKLALYPQAESIDALELLGNAAIHLENSPTIAKAFRRLTELDPHERHFQMNYGGALLQLALPYMSQLAFERLVRNWQNDPLCQAAQETLDGVKRAVQEMYASFPWSEEERNGLALLHEEMMFGLACNDFKHVIKYGELLLARAPSFPPAFNNLSLAYREAGRVGDSIRLSQELLSRNPQNPHALVILGDSLYAQGKRAAAREVWSRLRTLAPANEERLDCIARQIEALARLGDYAAVLDMLEAAEQRDLLRDPDPAWAVIYHLAGVAAARLGQHRTASQHWTRALQINPNYYLAEDNREDHEQPEGEREGPWLEERITWLPRDLAVSLLNGPASLPGRHQTEEERQQAGDRQMEAAARTLAELYPELPDLVGDVLERGSPETRQLIIFLCKWSNSPVLHGRLRDFAFSPYGSDAVRFETAMWLHQKGVIADKNVKLWSKGVPTEILLLGSKISFESKGSFPEEVQELHTVAYEAFNAHQFAKSEKLYRECVAIAGDNPTMLFNLASSIEHQGRKTEAEAMHNDIIQRWPDYFFGKIHLVKRAVIACNYVEARRILGALAQLEEFHVSEFMMLCFSYIELELRCGRPEAAESWLEQARRVDPDNPNIKGFEQDLSRPKLSLGSIFSRLWGR